MGVIYAGLAPEAGCIINRQDGIQVNGTYGIHTAEKQQEKQFQVKAEVKQLAPVNALRNADLLKASLDQRFAARPAPPYEGHLIARLPQGVADADHALVIVGIGSNGQDNVTRAAHKQERQGTLFFPGPVAR